MNKTRTSIALAAVMAMGLAAPVVVHAQSTTKNSAPTSTASKQRSGDGDTGFGDRGPSINKQRSADGDTGFGDRGPSITKQRTADGDTGAGDRGPSIVNRGVKQ